MRYEDKFSKKIEDMIKVAMGEIPYKFKISAGACWCRYEVYVNEKGIKKIYDLLEDVSVEIDNFMEDNRFFDTSTYHLEVKLMDDWDKK